MTSEDKLYVLWDEFLSLWPLDRLARMTLDEYSQAGSKDSFTYWIESGLDELGSIWGGSSFKFGVFSRKDTEDRNSDAKLSYSDTHGWYTSLGTTAEEAFTQVRGFVVQVAELAANGNLDGIEDFKQLGEAYKWKIAFHYQDRQAPRIVDIFKTAPLSAFAGDGIGSSMAALQKAALAKQPADLGILEFGRQIWAEWSEKNLTIWKLSHGNPPNFTDDERQRYLDSQLAVIHSETGKGQGRKFAEAPVGTLFFLCHGNSPQRVGQFISQAAPCDKGDGWLQRNYRILKSAVRSDRYTENSKYWSPQGNTTFWQVGTDDLPEFDRTLLVPYFGTSLAELAGLAGEPIEADSLSPSLVKESVKMPSTITAPINRIYYGPPGTGKTYELSKLLQRDYEQAVASISNEEWRNQVIAEKVAALKWWEGAAAAIYDLGGKAKVSELAGHPFIQAIASAKGRSKGIKQTLWGTLQHHTIENSKTVNTKLRMAPAIFDKTSDSVWQFADDWQDACEELIELVDQLKAGTQSAVAVQRYSFVTFHQSYGYEEFVEGLRPLLSEDIESGDMQYEIRPGVFKELCRKARLAPDQRFAMVIDEINRGNISKIFGELITLIESDKREGAEHAISLTLPYSGEPFSVPANVDIIGTMNTADRSLALLDTALRRRFDFVPVMPDVRDEPAAPLHGLRVTLGDKTIDIPRMLAAINQRVEALYDRDHSIGHAYLTSLKKVADGEERFKALAQVFRNRILPLLEEYFFEDWQKIRLVLADNQKIELARFVIESQDHEVDLTRLFGSDHDLNEYSTKRRYTVQEAAFSSPDAYIGIYQTLAP